MGNWFTDSVKKYGGAALSGGLVGAGADALTGGHASKYINSQFGEGGMFGDATGTQGMKDQAGAAGAFAGQGEAGFGRLGGEADLQRKYMENIARGRESVSAMQLKDSLGQNVAAQQAMAASARPGSGAMAARAGMQQAGRMGAGLAGQQAVAGIQERQSAQNSLNQMLMKQRQQEMQVALQSRQNAIGAFNPDSYGETGNDKVLGVIKGAGQAFGIG